MRVQYTLSIGTITSPAASNATLSWSTWIWFILPRRASDSSPCFRITWRAVPAGASLPLLTIGGRNERTAGFAPPNADHTARSRDDRPNGEWRLVAEPWDSAARHTPVPYQQP